MPDSPLVAYVWSQTLQEAADQLPYNLGRSTVVHDLIRSLDLLDITSGSSNTDERAEDDSDRNGDEQGTLHLRSRSIELGKGKGKGKPRSRARVVEPDMSLGTAESLRRYHDSDYVGVCVCLHISPFRAKADDLCFRVPPERIPPAER
jgi:histone deacetylase 1/2/histone deacetylase 8